VRLGWDHNGTKSRQVQRQTQHVVFPSSVPSDAQGAVAFLSDPLHHEWALRRAVRRDRQMRDVADVQISNASNVHHPHLSFDGQMFGTTTQG